MPNAIVRADATGLSAQPSSHPALTREGLYGQRIVGICMVPLIDDGDVIVCDPSQTYDAGDIVVIYHQTSTGEIAGSCKRLAMSIMPGITFPYRPHPQSEVSPLVVFECLSPAQTYQIPAKAVLGMHKVVGKRSPEGQVDSTLIEANAKHWKAQIRRRQAARRKIKVVGVAS